jgi:hypothetical protein
MEDFRKRTTLILVAAFLVANLSLFVARMEMKSRPAANCTRRAPNMICTDDR